MNLNSNYGVNTKEVAELSPFSEGFCLSHQSENNVPTAQNQGFSHGAAAAEEEKEQSANQMLEISGEKKRKMQSREENRKYADLRRKQQVEDLKSQLAFYEQQKTQSDGFDKQGIAETAPWQQEEPIFQMEKSQDEGWEKSQETNFLKGKLNEILVGQDLEKINQVYPHVETLDDLPDGFIEIMATGKVINPVAVYELLCPKRAVPASSGSVKSLHNMPKEYYSSAEVDKLTAKDLDEKTLQKIFNSMKKW